MHDLYKNAWVPTRDFLIEQILEHSEMSETA